MEPRIKVDDRVADPRPDPKGGLQIVVRDARDMDGWPRVASGASVSTHQYTTFRLIHVPQGGVEAVVYDYLFAIARAEGFAIARAAAPEGTARLDVDVLALWTKPQKWFVAPRTHLRLHLAFHDPAGALVHEATVDTDVADPPPIAFLSGYTIAFRSALERVQAAFGVPAVRAAILAGHRPKPRPPAVDAHTAPVPDP